MQGIKAIAEFVGNVVHSGTSSNFELHDATLDITDQETGFTVDYAFDAVVSKARDDGSIGVDAKGRMNGEPWKFGGDVKPRVDGQKRTFDFSVEHPGLVAALSGDYAFGSAGDAIDLKVTAEVPSLAQSLKIYGIKGELNGSSDISGRISGPLEA